MLYKVNNLRLSGQKHPGQNSVNKVDCWIYSHKHVKKCKEFIDKQMGNRLKAIRKASAERTKMHEERNTRRKVLRGEA